MNLTGVTAHGAELADMLATLLVRHGYLKAQPADLDELLTGAREAMTEPAPAFLLIQEGGSSSELYVHAWDSEKEAEADRESCADDGAYRTSRIVEVPGALADHPAFCETVEELVRAAQDLGFPDE